MSYWRLEPKIVLGEWAMVRMREGSWISTDAPLVQDIKRVHKVSTAGFAEKMSSIMDEAIKKQQKDDWSVTLSEMSGFEAGDKLVMKKVKPSLLTKLKNRFKK